MCFPSGWLAVMPECWSFVLLSTKSYQNCFQLVFGKGLHRNTIAYIAVLYLFQGKEKYGQAKTQQRFCRYCWGDSKDCCRLVRTSLFWLFTCKCLAFKKPTYGELIDLFEQSDNAEQLLSNFLISFPDMKSQIGRTDRFWNTVKRLAAPSQPSLTGKIALEGTQLSHYRSKTWEPRIRNKTGLWWLYNVSLVYFPYLSSDITFPLELNEYGLDEELLTAVFDQILSATEPLLWYLKGVSCVVFY